jgi:hypothetical protein
VRALIPLLFAAACSGGAAKPPVVEPEPTPAPKDPGAILYGDSGVKGHRWVDLGSGEHGDMKLTAAVLAGGAGDTAWLAAFETERPDLMYLAKVMRADDGLVFELVDMRPSPVWNSKSILQRTVTGARAVSPAGNAELLVCPENASRVCVRPIDRVEVTAEVDYDFENPSYAAWTDGGRVVFDPRGDHTQVVFVDAATGRARDAGAVDGWSIPTVSRDGRQLAWFVDAALHVRPAEETRDEPRTIPLPGAGVVGICGFTGPEQVVCATAQDAPGYRLFVIDLGAGSATLLSDELGQPMWVASPDGTEIAVSQMTASLEDGGVPRLAIVPVTGGEPRWVDEPGDTLQYPVAWVRRGD